MYYPTNAQAKQDVLSGKQYAPVYGEENPFAPYFVGFDQLVDRGVSRDETRYINDVLTNFTLYNKQQYKAKVSYVKDSFERNYDKELATTYQFDFGINDANIHTVAVTADMYDKKMSIKIIDEANQSVFDKKFDILLSAK